jgi:hypothetical protein
MFRNPQFLHASERHETPYVITHVDIFTNIVNNLSTQI